MIRRLDFEPRTIVWQVPGGLVYPDQDIIDDWSMSMWFDMQFIGPSMVFEVISIG